MNHREPPHSPTGARWAIRCLVLLLLSAMTPSGVHALPRSFTWVTISGRSVAPTPYLPATGAPPLRFQETALPAVEAPPPPAPPASVAIPQTESATQPANATPPVSTPASSANVPGSGETARTTEVTPPSSRTPAPILPDDARPAVRPEDFLPYFQIPGSARQSADVTLLVPVPKAAPAPASLPPSTATYTQSPK